MCAEPAINPLQERLTFLLEKAVEGGHRRFGHARVAGPPLKMGGILRVPVQVVGQRVAQVLHDTAGTQYRIRVEQSRHVVACDSTHAAVGKAFHGTHVEQLFQHGCGRHVAGVAPGQRREAGALALSIQLQRVALLIAELRILVPARQEPRGVVHAPEQLRLGGSAEIPQAPHLAPGQPREDGHAGDVRRPALKAEIAAGYLHVGGLDHVGQLFPGHPGTQQDPGHGSEHEAEGCQDFGLDIIHIWVKIAQI